VPNPYLILDLLPSTSEFEFRTIAESFMPETITLDDEEDDE
jgi:hypothetical protein